MQLLALLTSSECAAQHKVKEKNYKEHADTPELIKPYDCVCAPASTDLNNTMALRLFIDFWESKMQWKQGIASQLIFITD